MENKLREALQRGLVEGATCKCLVSHRYGKIIGQPYISGDRIHAKTDSMHSGFMVIYDNYKFSEITREFELADLLEQALNLIDDFPYDASLQERKANITMNAQNLIWEIKNNAPKLLDDE